MKLNRDYAFRHLCVALLFFGLAAWSVWDGAVSYPRENRAWCERNEMTLDAAYALPTAELKSREFPHPRHKVKGQFYQAAVLAVLALVIAGRLGLEARRKFAFAAADVKSVDYSAWGKKRIAVATLASGEKVTLDAWHFTGVPEFLNQTAFKVPEDVRAES